MAFDDDIDVDSHSAGAIVQGRVAGLVQASGAAAASIYAPLMSAQARLLAFAPIFLVQRREDFSQGPRHELAARGINITPRLESFPATYLPPMPGTGGGAAGSSQPHPTSDSVVEANNQRAAEAHRLHRLALQQSQSLDTMLDAVASLQASLALTPHPSVHLSAALLDDKLYRWADAREHCLAALALDPHCATAALQVAQAIIQAGPPAALRQGQSIGDGAAAAVADAVESADHWLNRAEGSRNALHGSWHHIFEERGHLRLRQGRYAEAADNLWIALRHATWTSLFDSPAPALAKALRRLQQQG